MKISLFSLIGCLFTLSSACRPHPADVVGIQKTYTKVGLANHTRYRAEDLKITSYTSGGVALADPLGKLDGAIVDRAFDEVEACLRNEMPVKWTVGETAAPIGNCSLAKVPKYIDRTALLVFAPRDVEISKCSGRQGFPCYGDDIRSGIALKIYKKEILNTPECQQPLCARAIQWGFVIVVTHDLSQLKVGIAQAVTGCGNPWAIQLVKCI